MRRPCGRREEELSSFARPGRAGRPSLHILGLSSSRQDQGDVIGLLLGADPVIHGRGHDLADPGQRQIAIFPHQIDQPRLAEFPKIVFRFGHTVAVGQKQVAASKRDRIFLVTPAIEQADHGASALQPAHGSIFAQDDRRQVPAVAVGEPALLTIVDSQEKSGVLFRGRALVELMIEQ